MPSCLPPRYRFLDLLFALWGTLAFLADLGLDVWSAIRYYKAGDVVWAVLQLFFYVLSSSVLQLLSWGWFWVDRRNWPLSAPKDAKNGHYEETGGVRYEARAVENGGHCEEPKTSSDSAERTDAAVFTEETAAPHTGSEGLQLGPPAAAMPGTRAHAEKDWERNYSQQSPEHGELFILNFSTSRLLLRSSCVTLLHMLQLGYPLRCLHSLEVGIAAYRNPEFSQYQDYAYFLTHDISMMRLVETFLENTPQLILVLYIIIQRETIYIFQYFSIAFSFICISWAILDYHQSLRMFLKEKEKLTFLPSVIYFVWNFCLISARILSVTLFTVAFQWMIALHFLFVWAGFFIWTCLQKTEFMKNALLEIFYRASVAIILYFSWFNIADGKTIYRCVIYHIFITMDSIILLFSWKYYTFPTSLDNYETFLICTFGLLTFIGLLIKPFYYKCVHPNVIREGEAKEYFDEPDAVGQVGYRMFVPVTQPWRQNERMLHLANQIYW